MQRHMETGRWSRRRSLRRRFGRAVTTLGLLTAVACTSAQTPGSVAGGGAGAGTADDVSVATWNMCGVRQWGCEKTGGPKEKLGQLRELIDDSGVQVLLLQEVCSEDLTSFARALGPQWQSAFEPYAEVDATGRRASVDCTGQGKGQAGYGLLAGSQLTDVEAIPTEQPTVGLHRGILCARVPAQRLRVCTAHLSLRESDDEHPDWDFRDDQLSSLFAAASTDAGTVFGGDFNTPPPVGDKNTSAWIWPREAYSTYRECDQKGSKRAGRATLKDGTKIDYLFTQLPRTACEVVDTKASDHRPLVMRVTRPPEDPAKISTVR
ncbi:endonuclease/exonuclease/phosphatase family protein [Streptomyces virginiae]|uniref:endonuclease/exonuclease/phosphatase family protein n=1 Tax=Streptomyces virginiae TaxID=1961 RepID=UPI00224E2FCD|nr:endonuclease/exonuclease/phosphatase family protein [Streptomyces virginiae]MCX4718511.1 endonuclease/exonuclease/phosphatase family protein [Streptomyces virginiae]MCX5276149.1 endonuclease/exonuclease/phosphatase family protein [Streptomyces virginiae]